MAEQKQAAIRLSGVLLSAARHVITAVTVLAALSYIAFATLWMHAPMPAALGVAATMAALPLALAWLCGRIGRRLRSGTPVVAASPAPRWLPGGAALVVLVVLAASTMTVLARKKQYECSIDPARTAAAREQQIRNDGFERVCEGDLARFDISLDSLDGAIGKLAFIPVDLARTPFTKFASIGGTVESIGGVPSRLYRGFRMPDGHRLILSEHDMSADGTRSWRDPEDEPERVNGLPARLIVLEDQAGAAVSHLSWTEGRRSYELWIDANVVKAPLRAQLFALAASLPKSVPGCPNEPPPRPFRPGPDGFPSDEPMPAVLTQADIDALSAKQPCK